MKLFVLLLLFGVKAWAENIVVEDPTIAFEHELPSGNVHLKSYRAPQSVIERYSRTFHLQGGDIKDFAKAPDCTRAEIHALTRWTDNQFYQEVNRVLRSVEKGKVKGQKVSESLETFILMIASGVNCAPQYDGEVTRIEQTPESILEQYQPGNYILSRGFFSSNQGKVVAPTINLTNAEKITVARARGADIHALGISAWPREKEVLILPGMVFKVISREEIHGPSTNIDHLFVFEQIF